MLTPSNFGHISFVFFLQEDNYWGKCQCFQVALHCQWKKMWWKKMSAWKLWIIWTSTEYQHLLRNLCIFNVILWCYRSSESPVLSRSQFGWICFEPCIPSSGNRNWWITWTGCNILKFFENLLKQRVCVKFSLNLILRALNSNSTASLKAQNWKKSAHSKFKMFSIIIISNTWRKNKYFQNI